MGEEKEENHFLQQQLTPFGTCVWAGPPMADMLLWPIMERTTGDIKREVSILIRCD